MKRIFQFDSINKDHFLSIDEYQNDPRKVLMRVHHHDEVLVLEFEKDEFFELCGMRYRMDFPIEVTAQSHDLKLVA